MRVAQQQRLRNKSPKMLSAHLGLGFVNLKKIRKKILPELKRRKDLGLPMTKDEREFLAEMQAGS